MSVSGIAPGLCNLWINAAVRNVPYAASITCIQLHIGEPGATGMSNPSAVVNRKQAFFTGGINGATGLTGTLPQFLMTAAEMLTHISVWSGFDGDTNAAFQWSMELKTPQQVAGGDQYIQNSANLTFLSQAA